MPVEDPPAPAFAVESPTARSTGSVYVGTGTPSDGVPYPPLATPEAVSMESEIGSADDDTDYAPSPAQPQYDYPGATRTPGVGVEADPRGFEGAPPIFLSGIAPGSTDSEGGTRLPMTGSLASRGYPRVSYAPTDSDELDPSLEGFARRLVKVQAFLRRHAPLLGLCSVLSGFLGATSYFAVPPPRVAVCKVTLHPQAKLDAANPDSRRLPSSHALEDGIEHAFTSEGLIRGTLLQMGIKQPDDGLVMDVAERLKFENVGSNQYAGRMSERLLSRGFGSPVEFLSMHLKNYIDTEIHRRTKVFVTEVDFLRKLTTAADREIKQIADQIVQYREKRANELEKTAFSSSRSRMEASRTALTATVHTLEGELAGLRSRLQQMGHSARAEMEATQPNREALDAMNRNLTELRAQGFADTHPEVRRIIEEKQNLEKQLELEKNAAPADQERDSKAAEDALRSEIDQLESQLIAARSERAAVTRNLKSLRQLNEDIPVIDPRLDELSRRQEGARRLHAQLYERLRKAEVQLKLERVSAASRYEITSPAQLLESNAKRGIATRGALGFVLGLLGALLFVGGRSLSRAMRMVKASET